MSDREWRWVITDTHGKPLALSPRGAFATKDEAMTNFAEMLSKMTEGFKLAAFQGKEYTAADIIPDEGGGRWRIGKKAPPGKREIN